MAPPNGQTSPKDQPLLLSPSSEYYHYRQAWIPLRWLPSEAVFEDDYSTKTDVWSFGVLMWEVFSLGELPHAALDHDKVLEGEGSRTGSWKCYCY